MRTIKESLKAAYENSKNQEAEVQKQVETLKTEVLDLQKRSIQYNILKREVDTNRSLYEGLLQRYKEVDVASGVGANNVFIVDRAEMPGAPSSPQMSRALMLSFALGLGAGLGAAYVLERLDDTIKSPEEMRAGHRPCHAGHHSQGPERPYAGGRACRSALGAIGSLPLAMHCSAVLHREWPAEDVVCHQRGSRRRASRSRRWRSPGISPPWASRC